MCNASESEATRTQGQRASAWSSVRFTLCPDLNSSSSDSNSQKLDKMATNVDRVPHRTLLMTATLTWPLSSSTIMDRDAAREDDLFALSNTKSQTHVAKGRRASSSASASYRATSSTPSYPAASSRWLASRVRLSGGPRSRSQILMPGHSSHEHHSCSLQNSVTSSPATSTHKVSLG
jgi:hypothetical protein